MSAFHCLERRSRCSRADLSRRTAKTRNTDRDLRSGGVTGIHPTVKGELYISANTAHFWQRLCILVGLPDLAEEPKYDTVRKRAKYAAEIVPVLREALKAHTALQWEEIFGEQVPCCAVRSIEEMFDHPQVLDQELVTAWNIPGSAVIGACGSR